MSMFKNAKTIEAKTSTAKKRSDKEEIHVAGLEDLAVVDTVVKTFTAIQKTLATEVKDEMTNIFVGMGKQLKKRPANFRGIDGESSASCELRVRSSRSALTAEETEMLDDLGVPYETVVEKEDAYVINPAYFDDQEMLEKVSSALESLGLPEDFILRQEKVEKKVVTEETVEAVFAKGVADSLLDIVGTLAIKPKYEGGDISHALEAAKKLAGLGKKKGAKK